VGDGVFLVAMREEINAAPRGGAEGSASLFGVDIQSGPVRAARTRLPEAQVVVGNFLLDPPPGPVQYDLIVGNPPYLGQRDVTRLDYADRLFDRYGFKDDLYVYFLHRSLELLRTGGVLAMVTSDSWLNLMGKEPLRRELLAHRIDHVVRLPVTTFGRKIYACCFALVYGKPPAKVWYTAAPTYRPSDPVLAPEKGHWIRQSLYANAPGAVIFDPTPAHRRVCRLHGDRLARWQAGRFTQRERTGPWKPGNVVPFGTVADVADVGIHTRNCRHRLFFAEKTAPHLQRLLQGRQIEPWVVRWDSPAARFKWVDITYRPRPGVKGVGRGGRPSRHDEYWEFQGDPRIHHLSRRILIRQTGDGIIAAYLGQTDRTYYTDNTLFTCRLTERGIQWGLTYPYLLGYLNSVATTQIYRFLSQEESRRQAQIKISLLRILPLRLPSRRRIDRIDRLVRRIIAAAKRKSPAEASTLIAECNTHFESPANG